MAKFEKGHPKYGGRKKGSLNKHTRDMREIMFKAFEALGGQDTFEEWCRENQGILFGKMMSSLVPRDVVLSGDADLVDRIMDGRRRIKD